MCSLFGCFITCGQIIRPRFSTSHQEGLQLMTTSNAELKIALKSALGHFHESVHITSSSYLHKPKYGKFEHCLFRTVDNYC